jgi:(2Fe-2S) ferredoxin
MTKYRLAVCKGPDCRKGGSDLVFVAAKDALASSQLGPKCEAYRGGCYGLCHLGPNVVVREDSGKPKDFLSREDFQLMGWPGEVHYSAMTPEKMRVVVAQHIGQDAVVEELRNRDLELASAPGVQPSPR